jgi:hypothetical protein
MGRSCHWTPRTETGRSLRLQTDPRRLSRADLGIELRQALGLTCMDAWPTIRQYDLRTLTNVLEAAIPYCCNHRHEINRSWYVKLGTL